MKKYCIFYWQNEKTKPYCLIQISKSGKWNGTRVWLDDYGKKAWQDTFKNNLKHGIDKDWIKLRPNYFINHKKQILQGINIIFK